MKNNRFVIHVGYPKAASTSLQDALLDSSALLKKNGVLYPASLIQKGSSKHEELFRLVRLNKVEKAIALLKKELDSEKNVHTVLLSTESIVNQLYNVDPSIWVKLFDGIKQLGSLELLVIHRELNSFVTSYYKQAVINQPSSFNEFYGTSLTQAEFSNLEVVKQLTNLDGVVEKLKCISKAPVRVFEYHQDVVSNVINWLSNGSFSIETPKLSNVSLQAEEVELIRQINAATPSINERNAWLFVLSHCSPLGSRTALTLAGRANEADLQHLDAEWLSTVLTAQNYDLGVNDNKLLLLAKKAQEWLSHNQRDYKLNQSTKCQDVALMPLKRMESIELERCIVKKIEHTVTATSNVSLGEKLFTTKKLELAPFAAVNFTGWANWEQDPLNNRSWQWRLNWLSFLSYLIAFHHKSRNDDVLSFAREAIESWLHTYLATDTSYPFEFIWHDHATALRAEQLALFVYYCRAYSPKWVQQNIGFIEYVEQALTIHGEWLAKDSFYSEHTNHGLEQARVLFLLGTIFEGEKARAWQKLATRRIKSELDFSFTTEGVHVENSPAYHIFVFKVFLGILKDYPSNVLGDLAEQFEKFSAQALGFITHILRPDGTLPPIGDTEQLPTSDAYREMFGHTIEYQHFLYAVSQGKQGLKPAQTNRVYAKSGYAVFRDCWPESAYFSEAFHIIAKVGCSSRYHHQQDEGHISIYAGGEDWLIDSGLYNYINKDPIRKYMRGRAAHNVPIISNARYADDFEHRLSAWSVLDCSELEGSPYVSMQLDVMPPVNHQRCLQFDSHSKIVKIADKVNDVKRETKDITLQWHFPSDKTISIEGQEITVTSKSGNKLLMSFEGSDPDALSVVKGKKGEKVFSCISYKANSFESSQSLRVLFKKRRSLKIITKLKFLLTDEHIAPIHEPDLPNIQSSSSLLASLRNLEKPIRNSVVLGSSSSGIELAQLHRDFKLGGVKVLVNTPQQCSEAKVRLKDQPLSPWITYTPLKLSNTTHVTIDGDVLDGIAGVDLLVIVGSGFEDHELEKVILLSLPQLLDRMHKGGSVWVTDSLPPKCKDLCEAIIQKYEVSLIFAVGLD